MPCRGAAALLLLAWPRASAAERLAGGLATPGALTVGVLPQPPASAAHGGLAAAAARPGPAAAGDLSLSRALELRGGSEGLPAVAWAVDLAFDAERLWPLLGEVDMSLRVGLMGWAVYDKILRSLKILTPTPTLHRSPEHLMMVGGLELSAIQTMRALVDKHRVIDYSFDSKRTLLDMSKQLAADFELGVEVLADFALSVGEKTFKEAIRLGRVLSVSDAVECKGKKPKQCKPKGKQVKLTRKALAEVAALDATRELLPDTPRAEGKITLLGLVAALCHESVFARVQERLLPMGSPGRLLTIAEFKAIQGVDSAAGLVRQIIQKYKTPKTLLNAYLALYTVTSLRVDPTYFQVAWGIRLGAALLRTPWDPSTSDAMLGAFSLVEVKYRFGQLFELYLKSMSEFGLSAFDHLRAVHAVLTVILFLDGAKNTVLEQLAKSMTKRIAMGSRTIL